MKTPCHRSCRWGILILLISFNCTTTRMVGINTTELQSDSIDLSELQNQLENEHVKITQRDGKIFSGFFLNIKEDSVHIFDKRDGLNMSFSTQKIRQIETTHHTEGAVIGFFSGVLGGLFYCYIQHSSTKQEEMHELGDMFRTMIGGVGGLLMGGIAGHVYIYQFSEVDIDTVTVKTVRDTPSSE
jgi:hypothetical protein